MRVLPRTSRRPFLPGVKSRRGLTLVELSVVLLVMSMLLGIMFGVYSTISGIAKNVSPNIQKKKDALSTLELIRSSINRTFYMDEEERLIFVGRKGGSGDTRNDRLTFASVNPGGESVGMPEVREVSFYLDQNSHTLFMREDAMVDDHPGEGGNHYPILTDVLSLEFSYSLKGKSWTEEWSSKKLKKIPLLVRIQIRVQIGNDVERFETLGNPGLVRE